MRDAQSLLDQVISFSDRRLGGDDEIGQEDALSILGIVPVESYLHLLEAVAAADAGAVMEEVHRVASLGVDIPRYVNGFADMLRTVRLLRNGVSVADLLGLSRAETELVGGVTASFHDEELSMMFRIASELQGEMRFSANERVNLEMALLDMIAVRTAPSLSAIVSRLDGGETAPAPPAPSNSTRTARGPAVKPAAEKEAAAPGASLRRHWESFLGGIKDRKQYLHCILKPSAVSITDDTLRITFPGEVDHSYYSRILEASNIDFIKKEMSGLVGRPLRVVVGAAGEGAPPPVRAGNAGGAPTEGDGPPPVPEAEMIRNPGVEEYQPVNPAVEKIKNVFHGRIVEKKGEG
jgi:hypothetical protein